MHVSCSNAAGSALGGEGGSGRCGLSRHPCRVRRALDSLAPWVVTIVATAAVHWPAEWHSLAELAQGYVITDDGHGNFKLPLIFMVMLWPLMFFGAGQISLDALLGAVLRRKAR